MIKYETGRSGGRLMEKVKKRKLDAKEYCEKNGKIHNTILKLTIKSEHKLLATGSHLRITGNHTVYEITS